ncbi:T9SS C-terminal target domain-containing protein [Pontibacter sp. KCTC 32443]|uniref:T9SS C-terminal target domain-containing protein n=1 Tax=Pontibacter TaxID=323449 RepID=UPI00164EAA44|nr:MULTISPECIES: T9SS C-terminal target domain-containing protein [Pontibacter]MBC5774207.1 T9SS C-terminal target domain-containing protein [Pontibacter sp. KCTC 32443]
MKKVSTLLLLALLGVATVACKEDGDDTVTPIDQPTGVVELSGVITTDVTLKADKKYLLKGFVYVQAPAKLTIEPGTIIKGDKSTKGSLIIERGAQIIARGTVDNPIVFTSNEAKGSRKAGDWGGLIILGKAPVNLGSSAAIEGGVDRLYGGNEATDNSGVLKYVRVEFAGIAFQPDNEINGITFGGVGSGTEIDYVQVSYSGDDSFEWFGGTVNAKHLIAYKTVDDMFDTDNGYAGTVQYAVGISDPNVADVSKSNGFESDNNKAGDTATPNTTAKFSNVSLFGPLATASTTAQSNYGSGIHFKKNTKISVYNSVIAGWPTGMYLDGAAVESGANNNELNFKNNYVVAATTPLKVASGSTFNIQNWFDANANQQKTSNTDVKIENSYRQSGAPTLLPGIGSVLLSGASFNNLSGFEQVQFVGAFGATDWTAGWANFDPQNTDY